MLTRRLLTVARGAGVWTVPPLVPFTVTAANDGGWPAQTGVWQYGGTTFFGYVDGDGNIEARAYDHATSVVSAAGTLHAALEVDHHNSPGMVIRASDRRLVMAYCKHQGAQLYLRISTNPTDVSSWQTEQTLDSTLGGTAYTYPNLFELDGQLFLFYRDLVGGTARLCFSTSTDGGATWAAQTVLFSKSGALSYWRIDSDGVDRFDVIITNGTGGTSSAYHFYYRAGSYYKSDGTLISASLPLNETHLTLAYSGASAGVRYPAGIATNGGAPVAVLVTQPGGSPPNDYRYCVYDGGWTDQLIAQSGADPGSPMFEGGVTIDRSDPTRVFLSRYVSSQWHIFVYQTVDAGLSWLTQQVTTSGGPHFYPVAVPDRAPGLAVLWLTGSFVAQDNFDLGIVGSG